MVDTQEMTGNDVLARDVSFETYMAVFAEHHTEWVEEVVIKLSPVTEEHNDATQFFAYLLKTYLDETGEGRLFSEPFVMRVTPDSPAREPDLHIVLQEHAERVKSTMTDGPADIAIEVMSKESRLRDQGEKFNEYEAGGVTEYWLFDPLRQQADFYRLGENSLYQRVELENNMFRSAVLKRFRLDVRVLWQNPLPTSKHITALVETMLKKD